MNRVDKSSAIDSQESFADSKPHAGKAHLPMQNGSGAASSVSRQAGPYAGLSSSMNARQAALHIVKSLYRTAGEKLQAIRNLPDPELIHDFRVSVRRLRTLLGQYKLVFPQDAVDSIRGGLSYLGEISNRTRDIDVLVAKEYEYANRLPEKARPGLLSFFKILRAEREKEFRSMLSEFNSEKCRRTLESLDELLAAAQQFPETENSSQPAETLARRFIMRKFRKIVVESEDLGRHSSDKDVHRLRIDCKHLRYLIEFFSPLLPEKEAAAAIRRMKKLQDRLGRYNDLSVQEKHLSDRIAEGGAEWGPKSGIPASLRLLADEISEEKKLGLASICKAFRHFCGNSNRRKFKKNFSP